VTLFLNESDVRQLLPMDRALECVEASFVAQGNGRAVNRSRERILLPKYRYTIWRERCPNRSMWE